MELSADTNGLNEELKRLTLVETFCYLCIILNITDWNL